MRSLRRDLLRGGLQAVADLAARTAGAYVAGYLEANPPPPEMVRTVARPPGARTESVFRARCTGCGDCVTACPYETLAPGPDTYPWLWDPAGHPCYRCDDFPCIAACNTGALSWRLRSQGEGQGSR
jgi:ferredoxin-type protein NapG